MARSMQSSVPRMGRAIRRGFTLVELMIVVSIIGILAALAIYGLQKYQRAAGTGEAIAMLQSIRGAEANFKSENLTYGGCGPSGVFSSTGLTTYAAGDLYPRPLASLDDKKMGWGSLAGSGACFARIGIRSDGPVRFGYGVTAGPPGVATPAVSTVSLVPVSTPVEPWFTAAAIGDQNDNNVYARLSISSMQNDVFVENETE